MRRVTSMAGLVMTVLLGVGACAPAAPRPASGGDAPTAGDIRDVTHQRYSNYVEWRFTVTLRDLTGAGLHLTRVHRSMTRARDVRPRWGEHIPVDLHIEPYGSLRIPCWEAVWFYAPGAPAGGVTSGVVPLTKIFTGQDGAGGPVTIVVETELDTVETPAATKTLEFARVADRAPEPIAHPQYCERVPQAVGVIERARAADAYLEIGTPLSSYPGRVETRWRAPGGDPVHITSTPVKTWRAIAGYLLFDQTIHQLPHALFHERPGPWAAELYVNGRLEGTYPFDVR